MQCLKCKKEIPPDALFCPWCGRRQQPEARKALKRPNGTGSVYKLSGRRTRPWIATRSKVVVGYYAKKTEALEALARLQGRTLDERYNMTFADVYADWKLEHFRTIGPQGVESYTRAYDVFKPLHDKKFRTLRTADFQSIIDAHPELSYSSLSKYKQLCTQLARFAIRQEVCTTDFATFIKLPENEKQEKEIFSDDEIKKLIDDGSEPAKIVLMLIYTGMRIGELFSLPLADYHETYCIGGEKTKAGRNRVIPIRAPARPYFADLSARASDDLLISGYKGQHSVPNFRRRDYYPLLERLGIEKKTPHATRHTFASQAVSRGVPREVLQKVLGHASYTTTADVYVHADIAQLVSAIG